MTIIDLWRSDSIVAIPAVIHFGAGGYATVLLRPDQEATSVMPSVIRDEPPYLELVGAVDVRQADVETLFRAMHWAPRGIRREAGNAELVIGAEKVRIVISRADRTMDGWTAYFTSTVPILEIAAEFRTEPEGSWRDRAPLL